MRFIVSNKFMKEFAWIIPSLIIGLIFSYLIVPGLLLNPQNINIFSRLDPLHSYIGWGFYRHSPWEWPVTFIQNPVFPIGTSIVFTDSLPIVCIILKIFTNYLPDPFVWHGIVVVINSSLMFYSGSLFLRVLRPNIILSIIGGLFTILSSIFISRIAGHCPLTTQWLIIFQILLILKPEINIKRDIVYQLVLLFISAGTHPYFMAMLTPLSFALCWKFYARQKYTLKYGILNSFIFILFVALSFYFFGGFANYSTGSKVGFGAYGSNLLTFIIAQFGLISSSLIQDTRGLNEGSAYLGIGIIIPLIFLIIASPYGTIRFFKYERLLFIIIIFLFFLFSLSNIIRIGPYSITIFDLQDNSILSKVFGIFRASGRFIWPIFYMVQFLTLIKLYDYLENKKVIRTILFLVLIIYQILDNWPMISERRYEWRTNTSNNLLSSFESDVWYNLKAYNIKHIFALDNITYEQDKWLLMRMALIALKNNVTFNKTPLARENGKSVLYNQKQNLNFKNSILLDNTLYIGKNKKGLYYPPEFCSILDNYIMCSKNPSIIAKGSPIP
jgi:hypothetical protein